VQSTLGKYRWVHLATHGYFALKEAKLIGVDNSNFAVADEVTQSRGYLPGLLSGIVLAEANKPINLAAAGDDGILTAAEVTALDLRGVETVVLSACDTGLGHTAGGEGVLGLQRALQIAGARTVVASLWEVPDEATRHLMTHAY
jgi:CHAT domain-containing protein